VRSLDADTARGGASGSGAGEQAASASAAKSGRRSDPARRIVGFRVRIKAFAKLTR
jgi:hypothetical protein